MFIADLMALQGSSFLLPVFLVSVVMAGCSTSGDSHGTGPFDQLQPIPGVNRPPYLELKAMLPTEGTSPLPFNLTWLFGDDDADNLTVGMGWDDDILWSQQEGIIRNPGMKPGFITGSVLTSHDFHIRLYDGEYWTNATIALVVNGPMARRPFAFNITTSVTATCDRCSGTVYPIAETERPLGAPACKGFNLRENQTDCTWIAILKEWEGHQFEAFGTTGNVDVEMRTDCSGNGRALHYFTSYADERNDIPPDTGCVVLWTVDAPSSIRFSIYV